MEVWNKQTFVCKFGFLGIKFYVRGDGKLHKSQIKHLFTFNPHTQILMSQQAILPKWINKYQQN